MATPAWQPPGMQTATAPMALTQGHWGESNTGVSQQQGPPQRLPFPPAASQQNANNTNPNAGNPAGRPVSHFGVV